MKTCVAVYKDFNSELREQNFNFPLLSLPPKKNLHMTYMMNVFCDLHADPFRVVDDRTNGRGAPEGELWTMAHSCTSPSPSDVVYTVDS